MKVPVEVGDALASYVYVYIDPRTHLPFYVGKGKGNRLFSHLDDQTESEKVRHIAELRAAGCEPEIHVLRYGLSDAEAALVEAAAIDLIGRPPLTNIVAGHHAQSFGRVTSQEVIAMLTATPVVVREPAILITINRLYRSGMNAQELYEATRGFWVVGPRREKAELALAVYQAWFERSTAFEAGIRPPPWNTRRGMPKPIAAADAGNLRARSPTPSARTTWAARSARADKTQSGM